MYLFLLSFLLIIDSLRALTTSVIIPCHPDHVQYLESLLISYRDQTVLPDEIIISLSQAHTISKSTLIALECIQWPFELHILKHKEKFPPGRNRNEACYKASKDIIICQDADDLPHPQRVEIIRSVFETYMIDHLLHQWISSQEKFQSCDATLLRESLVSFRTYDLIDVPYLHNGNNAFRRYVFEKLHWKPIVDMIQEDVLFNRTAYAFFPNRLVLKLPLIMYRPELSTFDLDGTKKLN